MARQVFTLDGGDAAMPIRIDFLSDTGHHFVKPFSKRNKMRGENLECKHCNAHTKKSIGFVRENVTRISVCYAGQQMLFGGVFHSAKAWLPPEKQ
jgi:hypothetical protein